MSSLWVRNWTTWTLEALLFLALHDDVITIRQDYDVPQGTWRAISLKNGQSYDITQAEEGDIWMDPSVQQVRIFPLFLFFLFFSLFLNQPLWWTELTNRSPVVCWFTVCTYGPPFDLIFLPFSQYSILDNGCSNHTSGRQRVCFLSS